MKKILIVIILVVVVAGVYHYATKPAPATVSKTQFDGRNASFTLDGHKVTLDNGMSQQEAAPGSASKVITRYFGNEAKGDLNGDGREDVVYLISQSTGGTGEFYYAVAALATKEGYTTTNAFLIGDRIAPQSTEISSREIHVNYADRKAGEPMTAQPSEGKVLLLKVRDGVLEGLMK